MSGERVSGTESRSETCNCDELSGSIQKYQSRDANGPVQVRLTHMIQPGPHQDIIQYFFVDQSIWIGKYDPHGPCPPINQMDDVHDPVKHQKTTVTSTGSALWIDPSRTYGHIHLDRP